MALPDGLRRLHRWGARALFGGLLLFAASAPVGGQGLADLDYENLSLQGVALDVGWVYPSRVESTSSVGARLDLGFLGPGVRVTVGFNRWSSFLTRSEVQGLETRLEELIARETGEAPPEIRLGRISWSDAAFNADAHFIWRMPLRLITYAGLGATAHVLRGGGEAIEDTFVEDLLDSVRAGVNVHGGLEYPIHRRFRLLGEARYELLENLSYGQIRLGGQFMFGAGTSGGAG